MEIFGYVASVFMGLSLGLIGGGGSILTVPILVYLFAINPITATAYSLFIVGITALVGGASYLRKQEVDLKTGFIFAIPSFIGVYLTRAYVVPNLPDPVFIIGTLTVSKPLLIMSVFSVLMLLASFSMIRSKRPVSSPQNISKSISPVQKIILIVIEGFIVGGVTGFVGAGGGFLIIPALVILVGLPMKIAVGTSLFIIAAKSLIGFIGDLQQQSYIDWQLLITISAISLIGLFVGMQLSKRISEKALKIGFGYFVLIMGAFILFDQVSKLNKSALPATPAAVLQLENFNHMRESLAATLDNQSGPITPETFKQVCAPVGQAFKKWGAENGYTVRQVAEKFRNPDNAPNQADKSVFDLFKKENTKQWHMIDAASDVPAGTMLYVRIPVVSSCLHCHGQKDSRPDFITQKYPGDLAYGFSVGDLRGLYSVFMPAKSK